MPTDSPRPEGCPDKTCKLFRARPPARQGASSWCLGELAEGKADAQGDFLHLNDLSLCLYDGRIAPAARLFTRTQDLFLLGWDILMMEAELEKLRTVPPAEGSTNLQDPVESDGT